MFSRIESFLINDRCYIVLATDLPNKATATVNALLCTRHGWLITNTERIVQRFSAIH